MKICPNCKSRNYDNAQLCIRCNYPFYNPNYSNITQQPHYNIPIQYSPYMNLNNVYQNNPYGNQNYYIEQQQNDLSIIKKRSKKNKIKTIIGLVLLLILLLIPSVILLNLSRNKTNELNILKTRMVQSTQAEATVRAVVKILEKNPATPAPERTPLPRSNTTRSKSSSNSSYAETLNVGDPHFTDVWICTQDLVKANLKAPRTAKFPSQYDISITFLGDSDYRILGYVDSQNSFGAMLRTNFIATLTLTSGGYKNGRVSFIE